LIDLIIHIEQNAKTVALPTSIATLLPVILCTISALVSTTAEPTAKRNVMLFCTPYHLIGLIGSIYPYDIVITRDTAPSTDIAIISTFLATLLFLNLLATKATMPQPNMARLPVTNDIPTPPAI
jgi:hypothetical protein